MSQKEKTIKQSINIKKKIMNVTSAWIIFGVVALLSWIVQISLNSKFKKYSQVPLPNGMTGADVARKMLRDNGITNVTVHRPLQSD